jgi:hypothetical protein
MGSKHRRLEEAADRRLSREQKGQTSTMNARTAFGRITGLASGPWQKPTFEMPHQMAEADVTDFLGDLRGARWYAHRKLGELAERPKMLNDRDVLPDLPIIQVDEDGQTRWRVFDVFQPGTFERLSNTAVRLPRPTKPQRAFDALALVWLAAPQPEVIVSPTGARVLGPIGPKPNSYIKPPQPAARGAEAILRRLASKGVMVALSADGQYLVPSSPGGRPGPGVIELLTTAAPLLLAHLKGGPLLCAVGPHRKGEDPTATTLLVGGCPACPRHVADPIEAVESRGAA